MSILKLDDIDKKIIQLLEDNPNITHSHIAKKLSRSQPAIGARIKKLERTGILAKQIGVNFKIMNDLNLVKVEMTTSNPEKALDMAINCPYIINALKISGAYNIMMFMACSNLRRLDMILDRHFRNQEDVSNIRMDLITGMAKPLILPINFSLEDFDDPEEDCHSASCPYSSSYDPDLLKKKPKKVAT